jgi:hypothetical protein
MTTTQTTTTTTTTTTPPTTAAMLPSLQTLFLPHLRRPLPQVRRLPGTTTAPRSTTRFYTMKTDPRPALNFERRAAGAFIYLPGRKKRLPCFVVKTVFQKTCGKKT